MRITSEALRRYDRTRSHFRCPARGQHQCRPAGRRQHPADRHRRPAAASRDDGHLLGLCPGHVEHPRQPDARRGRPLTPRSKANRSAATHTLPPSTRACSPARPPVSPATRSVFPRRQPVCSCRRPTLARSRFNEDNLSPEATLSWRPSEQVTLYAAYKSGYKPGGASAPSVRPESNLRQRPHLWFGKVKGGRGRYQGVPAGREALPDHLGLPLQIQ